METDPLQQLRDIHLPIEPSWWPPAVGWWIVLLGLLSLLIWLFLGLRAAWRRRAPIRAARKLYAELYVQIQQARIDEPTFAHECNALLKRLLVHGLHQTHLAPLVDAEWLAALDQVAGDGEFTSGPGQVLGTARFGTAPQIDVEGLHASMSKFFKAVTP